tara:strand:- start:4710 stop:4913 length:204 start_codon:yes stop_codon:yes gene_type:complete
MPNRNNFRNRRRFHQVGPARGGRRGVSTGLGNYAYSNTMGQTSCWCSPAGYAGAALPGCCPAGMQAQ